MTDALDAELLEEKSGLSESLFLWPCREIEPLVFNSGQDLWNTLTKINILNYLECLGLD